MKSYTTQLYRYLLIKQFTESGLGPYPASQMHTWPSQDRYRHDAWSGHSLTIEVALHDSLIDKSPKISNGICNYGPLRPCAPEYSATQLYFSEK